MKKRKMMGQWILEFIFKGILAGAVAGWIIGGWWIIWLVTTR